MMAFWILGKITNPREMVIPQIASIEIMRR
jgi:hypothetical protein